MGIEGRVWRVPISAGLALAVGVAALATAGPEVAARGSGDDPRVTATSGKGPFLEKNGIVVMEVESQPLSGQWKKEKGKSGYTGSGYYSWRGPNKYGNPGSGVITYPIRISSAGDYRIEVRARRDKDGRQVADDEENDVYVRLNKGKWTKLFHGTAWGQWGWARTFDTTEQDDFAASMVHLSKGDHFLRFSARSANFKMDRIHLHKGVEATHNPPISTPESKRAGSTSTKKKKKATRVWQTKTLTFKGPLAKELDNHPNPFLDYRLQVKFTPPHGRRRSYWVPGFFDTNGKGGVEGRKWRVHFTPDRAGTWKWRVSFRKGDNVAIKLNRTAGKPTNFNGRKGSFYVRKRNKKTRGFARWGRLNHVGKHYLRFKKGPHFIKTGAGEPENFLGYTGFDNTPVGKFGTHDFSPHVGDWKPGNPDWGGGKGKGIIGALNYLSSVGLNSIYFLTMNIGGDGQDVWPFAGKIDPAGSTSNNNLHYDTSKLRQWGIVFSHAQRKKIFLHFVLGEAEKKNKLELDNAKLGRERKLYYREMIARFGQHLALQWNVYEEYDFPEPQLPLKPKTVKKFAGYIQKVDPYNHPITVHNVAENPDPAWRPFLGDRRFSTTSFQFAFNTANNGAHVEKWRKLSKKAGRPIPISMDELAEVTESNHVMQRKQVLWPTLLSGGNLEYYFVPHLRANGFGLHQTLWRWTWNARRFVQRKIPFWKMQPKDGLLEGEANGAGQVFARPGKVYAIYLPKANPTGTLNLRGKKGIFVQRWYNPRLGKFEATKKGLTGNKKLALGAAPNTADEDWVVLVKKKKIKG